MCETKQVETIHAFEKAGLGKAPFRYLGMVYQDISYGLLNIKVQGANGELIDAQTTPGGTCDYCGHYILNMFRIESADGKKFKVGCDCIRKCGDAGLVKIAKDQISAAERTKRAEKKIKAEAAAKDLCFATDFEQFRSIPHPTSYRATEGETMADWCEWMRDNRNYNTLAAMIRKLQKAT